MQPSTDATATEVATLRAELELEKLKRRREAAQFELERAKFASEREKFASERSSTLSLLNGGTC